MADRIHPEPTRPSETPPEDIPGCPPATETLQSGSFVIQLPRDQIYRIPPPENDYHFKAYTRRAARHRRGSSCYCCLAYTAAALSLILLFAAAAAGILFLVFRPKLPTYSIDSVSVRGLNLTTSAAAALLPEVDVAIRADNPNKKIGIYYLDGGSVAVSFSAAVLCRGVWPTFYHGRRNVTEFHTTLKGSGLRLSDGMLRSLTASVNRRVVPLKIRVEVPVRVKFGAVTSWTVTANMGCDVTLDKLTADSRILSKSCNVKMGVF